MGMRQQEVSRIRIFNAVINTCSLDGCVCARAHVHMCVRDGHGVGVAGMFGDFCI